MVGSFVARFASKNIEEAGAAVIQPPSDYEEKMKQYLIVKVAEGLNQVASLIALPGLYTLEAAQQFIGDARANDPGAKFLLQEVGAA